MKIGTTMIIIIAMLFVTGYLYSGVHWALGLLAAAISVFCLFRFRHFFFGVK